MGLIVCNACGAQGVAAAHECPRSDREVLSSNDVRSILAALPQLPQRQDSTSAQILDLIVVANRLGMYDAADLLQRAFRQGFAPLERKP